MTPRDLAAVLRGLAAVLEALAAWPSTPAPDAGVERAQQHIRAYLARARATPQVAPRRGGVAR